MAINPGLDFEIRGKPTGFAGAFRQITAEAKQAAGQVQGAFSGLQSLRSTGAAIVAGLGAGVLIGQLRDIHDRTVEGERGLNQLNAVLKATGNSAGLTGRQLAELADEVQGASVFDDDAIRQAETALLRFRTVQGDTFRDIIRAAPDVASVLGTDLPSAAIALGKAITNPATGMRALKDAGVSLSDQQADLAQRLRETGDSAGAAKIVLEEVTRATGGAAGADNLGLYGASKRLTRAWEDLQKTAGKKIFADNAGSADLVTGAFDRLQKLIATTDVNLRQLLTQRGALASLAIDVVKTIAGLDGTRAQRTAVGKIRGLPDPEEERARQAAEEAARKEAENQRYADAQAALRRLGAVTDAIQTERLVKVKAGLERESALYREAYEANALATSDFYAQEREAAIKANQATQAGIEARLDAIEKQKNALGTSRDERAGLEVQQRQLAVQSVQSQVTTQQRLLELDIEHGKAIETLKDRYAELGVRLSELRGDAVGAATEGFRLENRDLFKRLDVEAAGSNPVAAARARAARDQLNEIADLVRLRAELTKATGDYERTLDSLGNEQQRIQGAESAGLITSLDALRARGEANKAYLKVLQAQLEALEALAAKSGRPEDLARLEQVRVQLEQIAQQTDLVKDKFNEIGASSFSSLLQDLASGKNALQALKDAGANLAGKITNVFADDLAQRAFGKDGIFSGFGDLFSKLLGGKDGGALALTSSATALSGSAVALDAAAAALTSAAALQGAGAGASAAGGWFGNILQGIGGGGGGGDILTSLQGFARGGFPTPGRWSVVGERGPELLMPRSAMAVVPLGRGGGGGTTINITLGGGASSDSRTARQIAREVRQALMAEGRRG